MTDPNEPLPEWLRDELDAPCAMGEGRNDQMIRIGPTLIKLGHDADSLFELFCDLYGDLDASQHREVAAVCRQAVKYASKEDAQVMKGEWIERKKILNLAAREARIALPQILVDFAWPLGEIGAKWMWSKLSPIMQREGFLKTLFKDDDVIWIGQVWETGVREKNGREVNYANRFKTLREWLAIGVPPRSEFVSHCTFKTGTNSRCNESVWERKYMVVESDILSHDEVGAVFRYLSEHQKLTLRAVVTTGGKSIHGWFDWPKDANEETVAEWAATLQGLKCDPSTLRPSQPVRLPGTTRRDTGRPQELIWLA